MTAITRWERLAGNPIVSPEPGSWDGEACYKPSVLREYVGMAIHEGLKLR